MRRPSSTRLTTCATLLPLALAPVLVLAPRVGAADYAPVDPPYVQRDKAGDAAVLRGRLDRTDLTAREARAADFTRVRYAVVEHDGERTAQISVTMRRVLPDRPGRHTQRVRTYFDEETFVETDARSGRSRYLSSFGGAGSNAAGCRRVDAEIDGTTIVQWVPTRCLSNDSSEMFVNSDVFATAPEIKAGRRLVGTDGAARSAPFIRWR